MEDGGRADAGLKGKIAAYKERYWGNYHDRTLTASHISFGTVSYTHLVRHRLDGILIGLGEGLLFLGLLHRHKSVGIYLQAETVLHGISDQIDLAVPDIAGFPLDGHVIGACDHAHHRKGIHGQGARCV